MFYVSPEAARDRAPTHEDGRVNVNAPGVVSGWYVMAEPGTKYDVVVCRVNDVAVDCYDNDKDKDGQTDNDNTGEGEGEGGQKSLKSAIDNTNNNKQQKKNKEKKYKNDNGDNDINIKSLSDRKSKKHRHGSSSGATNHHRDNNDDSKKVTKNEGRHHLHNNKNNNNDNDQQQTDNAVQERQSKSKKKENERDFQVSLRIDGQSTHTAFTFPRYYNTTASKQQAASVWIGFKEKSVTTVTTRRNNSNTSSRSSSKRNSSHSNGALLSKVIAKRRRTYRLFKFAKTLNGDGYDNMATDGENNDDEVNEALGVVQMKVYIGKSIPRPLSMSGHIKDSGNQRFRRRRRHGTTTTTKHMPSSSSSIAATAVAVEHGDSNNAEQQQQQHGAVSEKIAMKKGVSLFTAGDEQVEEVGSSFIFLRAKQVHAAGLTVLVRERHWLMSRRIINQYGNACSYDMFRMLTTIGNNRMGSGGDRRHRGLMSSSVSGLSQKQHASRRQMVLSQKQQQKQHVKQLYYARGERTNIATDSGKNAKNAAYMGVGFGGNVNAIVDDHATGTGREVGDIDIKPKVEDRQPVTDFIDLT